MKNPGSMSRLLFIGVFLPILFSMSGGASQSQANGCLVGKASPNWRFGITAPFDTAGYNLAALKVGGFLDWSASTNPTLPAGMDHVRVLRISDAAYPSTLASLPGWVASFPGAVWLVGNEPDVGNQDGITAEVYADRYYQIAVTIRTIDHTAQIGFGTVVVSPLRIRYLARAYDRLKVLAGSAETASGLIDIWSVHAFILNETQGWGVFLPVGFENDGADAITITNFEDTYSISIFSERIIAFRAWLAQIGQRDKPVWITEYGSLFPPIDNPSGAPPEKVSDQDTAAFMVATFDFLLKARDPNTGMPTDGQRLVQRWFWYSLNELRYQYGGSLYDPEHGKAITAVGQAFIQYTSRLPVCYLYLPQVLH